MTFEDVEAALAKGTVILNAIGAHVPKLAGPSLACTDATAFPNAINLYVTSAGTRTSAPPHTDKQDVVVVQTSGQKHWRVFAPTDASRKPMADIFARGKGDDSLPLYQIMDDSDTVNSADLLIETVLNTGDILFIPAAFPHTTSTAHTEDAKTSVHLTFNIDTHVWQQDYLSARRLALKRACVLDSALGQTNDSDNRYEGRVNELPKDVLNDIMNPFPMGFLDTENEAEAKTIKDKVVAELKRISTLVDETTALAVDDKIWEDTVVRLRQEGVELLETHRDMYLAAIKEGRTREAEEAMTAHLDGSIRKAITPERLQRMSLFRVKGFYEQMEASLNSLREWSLMGKPINNSDDSGSEGAHTAKISLPENWAFTLPVKVGDEVEADLGGAFFDAIVTRAAGGKFDVQFFDGDVETWLDRGMLKLKTPPAIGDDEVDTASGHTQI